MRSEACTIPWAEFKQARLFEFKNSDIGKQARDRVVNLSERGAIPGCPMCMGQHSFDS